MKNLWVKFLIARSLKFDMAVVALIFGALVIGCGGGSSSNDLKKPIPNYYLGTWTGADGTTITIRNDHTGDYKSGGSNVNGAAVEVDEAAQEIRFTMLGVNVGKYKIDKAASGNSMTLNGMVYKKSGGLAISDSNGDQPSDNASAEIPAKDEMDELVAQTMTDFDAAVQAGDFTDFHSNISEMWQKQITADKLQESFAQFIKQKIVLTPKTNSNPIYSPKPALDENGMLVVNGKYTTTVGKTPQFKLTYLKEDSGWRLFGIRINQ